MPNADLHEWARNNCDDPEVQGAIAGGHDCTGLILEWLLGRLAVKLRGWRSEMLRPGTAAHGALVRCRPRRDPSTEARALQREVVAAVRSAKLPGRLMINEDYRAVRRLEFKNGDARTGVMVDLAAVGLGVYRTLLVYAESVN